jgi:hypothetical protein
MAKGDTMSKTYEAKLTVNHTDIELSDFPQDFLINVAIAAVSTLKGIGAIETLDLIGDSDNTDILVNSERIRVAAFPNEYITNTLHGLISTLRGVENIESMQINIKAT